MATAKSRTIKPAYTRTRVQTKITERKTKAVQSERNHSDINNIVAKAYQTGQLPVLMGREQVPTFPDALTYQEALNKVVFAQQAFERLPSNIRAKFENDPKRMLDAIEHSKDSPELKKSLQDLGLLEKPAPASPAEHSGEAANGGEATAEPSSAPVSTSSEGGTTSNA